jgi:hypothetical protein
LVVTSVIATAATLARDRAVQYVHTGSHAVVAFSLEYEPE